MHFLKHDVRIRKEKKKDTLAISLVLKIAEENYLYQYSLLMTSYFLNVCIFVLS